MHMKQSVAPSSVQIGSDHFRIDDADAVRVTAPPSWSMWLVAIASGAFGHTSSTTGIVFLVIAVTGAVIGAALLLYFKRVQILRSEQWVTVAEYATPSNANALVRRIAAASNIAG